MQKQNIAIGILISLVIFLIPTVGQYYLRSPPSIGLKIENRKEKHGNIYFDLEIKNNVGEINRGNLEIKVEENFARIWRINEKKSRCQAWTETLPTLSEGEKLSWKFNIYPLDKENITENGRYKLITIVRVNGIPKGKTEDYTYINIGSKDYTSRDEWVRWSKRGDGLIETISKFLEKAGGSYSGW